MLYVTRHHQKPAINSLLTHAAVQFMEWPPEFILARLRQLARDKLQPSELLTILRELALQYKAFLANNAWRRDD